MLLTAAKARAPVQMCASVPGCTSARDVYTLAWWCDCCEPQARWLAAADVAEQEWESKWTQDYAGSSGVAVNPHQLILYQDKAKVAMEKHAEKMKIKKGRKRPARKLKNEAAYKKGKRDAETVCLGTRKLKTARSGSVTVS